MANTASLTAYSTFYIQKKHKWALSRRVVKLIFILLLSTRIQANVVLPALISDNMVMQQGVPVHIWGRCEAGENITVSILNQQHSALGDKNGEWQLWLSPLKSGTPVTMTISGENSIKIKNILIGEVWFASGQSNMEWNVGQSQQADAEIAASNFPEIRIFKAVKSYSDTIKNDLDGAWVICAPETVRNVTAVGFFFIRGLFNKLHVPCGLIEAAWGSTNCQTWTPPEAINADPRLNYVKSDWDHIVNTFPERKKLADNRILRWRKAAGIAKAAGTPVPERPRNAQIPYKNKPSVIYNALIAPLSKYTIRGVVWYQGEANAYEHVAYPYRYLFPAMIQGWRNKWGQGDFPFLFVQLSTLYKHPYWPVLRESQSEALRLKNTGMAVTYDIGDSTNAHYKNKQIVGKRLELIARKMVYGEDITCSGPAFRQATIEKNAIRIWFDNNNGLKPSRGDTLKGFQIAGKDGKLYPANAKICQGTLLLSSPLVPNPVIARYAFKDAPVGNLVNGENLPALPFSTDIHDGL